MGIKEKLNEIIANLTLIKAEQEAANRELEKQSDLLNPTNKLTSAEAKELIENFEEIKK